MRKVRVKKCKKSFEVRVKKCIGLQPTELFKQHNSKSLTTSKCM